MGTFIDFLLQYFDLFLIVVFIGLLSFIMNKFFKKKITIIIVIGIIIAGGVFVVEQMKSTTLFELYSDQLNEDTNVKSLSISINEQSGSIPEKIRSLTIEEDEFIEKIVEDFSEMELKKNEDIQHILREYRIEMVVTNQIEKDHFKTTTIVLDVDEKYLNEYRIVSETNHLKTIESLVNDEKMDWKELK